MTINLNIILDKNCRYIINVGSIGQPRDGNTNGCVASFDTDKRIVEFQRFDFNRDTTIRKMIEEHMPVFLYQRLLIGR